MLPPVKQIVEDIVIITSICIGNCVLFFTIIAVGENVRGFFLK